MERSKTSQNKSTTSQQSFILKQQTPASLCFTLKHKWIHFYLKNSDFVKRFSEKFPLVILEYTIDQLEIKNIQNQKETKKYISQRLLDVGQMVLSSQNLNQDQYSKYMRTDPQIKQMLKFFKFQHFVDNIYELYYLKSLITDQGLKKKKCQLQGYKKETLILDCKQLTPFEKYTSQNHQKLPLLLKFLVQCLQQEVYSISEMCKLHMRYFCVKNEHELNFTVIGFKKYFMNFHDEMIDKLFLVKTYVGKFELNKDDPGEMTEFEDLLKKQNEKNPNRRMRYESNHILVVGDDALPEDLELFINSSVKSLTVGLKESEVLFCKQHSEEIRKLIRRQVNYVDDTLNFKNLTIKTDSKNYDKCREVIFKYIKEFRQQSKQFYFNEAYLKHSFLKYFKNQIKNEIRDVEQEQDKIIFMSSEGNTKYVEQQLDNFKSTIQGSLKRILISSTHQSIKNNPRVKVYPNIETVQIGYLSNCVQIQNITIQITNRIQIQDIDCIVCCYKPNNEAFLDTFIQKILSTNTKNSIKRVVKKLELPYLQRISESFCSNLIVHKFNHLQPNKIYDDFDKIFAATRDTMRSIVVLAPVKFKYWQNYVEDFVDYILHGEKEFVRLRRICVACQDEEKEDTIRTINRLKQYEPEPVISYELNQHYLLKHQNLNFYSVQFKQSETDLLATYSFTPLLLSVLHQHQLFKSQSLILILPPKNTICEQYLINLESKTIIDTKTQSSLQTQEFKQKIRCLNSILKQNTKVKTEKNQNRYRYKYLVLYAKNSKIIGDYFELLPLKNKLIRLNEKYERTEQDYEFLISQTQSVSSYIIQGYKQEIQQIIESLKFTPI